MNDPTPPTVQVLERALDILEVLTGSPSGRGISEISGITRLPLSTVHRLLKVLKKRGYVSQDPESRKYLLQGKFPALHSSVGERIDQVSGHAI